MKNICKNVSSRPDGLFCRLCWNDSACIFFLLPLLYCFVRNCLPSFFAAVLKFFPLLTTSAISGAGNFNKSAPTPFAAGTIYLRKNRNAVLTLTCASALIPRPPVHGVDQYLYSMETLIVLKQPYCNVFWLGNDCWRLCLTSKQDEWYRRIQKAFFQRFCLSSQSENHEKKFWASVWIVGYYRSDSSCVVR